MNKAAAETWKILIVDDEPEVHILTRTVLKGVVYDEKGLEFLSAYNADETRRIIQEENDIALILMDVVMEDDQTGLELVRFIREDLGNRLTRIILRTGQPGEAPERRVIIEYEINDYKEKVDLTSNRLFTSVVKSLRNYRDLKQIALINRELNMSRKSLTRIIESSSVLFSVRSLDEFYDRFLTELHGITIRNENDGDGMLIVKLKEGVAIRATGRLKELEGKSIVEHLPDSLLKSCRIQKDFTGLRMMDGYIVGRLKASGADGPCLLAETSSALTDERIRLLEIFFANANIVHNNLRLEEESQATQSEMIGLLGDVIENRSVELQGHVDRVGEFAVHLAHKLEFPEEDMPILRDAVQMHDIGKIGIYDAVLQKPGKLTPDEFESMKAHTTIGYEILRYSSRKLFQMAAIIAWEHHERWDGKGYPRGLAGKDIHQLGRITCIVDVFDALSSDRVYRKAWSVEKTMQFIKDGSGTQFDPELVDLFLEEPNQITDIMARNQG